MNLKIISLISFIYINILRVRDCQYCGTNIFDPKFKKSSGLIHYFPFYYNTHDVISEFDLYDGFNANLTFGRPNRSSSYLSLRSGYYKFPPIQSMNSDFSVLLWVKVNSNQNWQRVLDFGNGQYSDNFVCALSYGTTLTPAFQIYIRSGLSFTVLSSIQLKLNTWYYLAYVLSYPTAYIYIDGEVKGILNITNRQQNITRRINFIGKSNWYGDPNADADFDELKIFNRGLTREEILFEMNNEVFL